MAINAFQAAILGLFACLASLPGMGGTTIGNYTLGRPLVAGLVVGIILGDVQTGIIVGAAIQLVYIALVTPGGTVSADVRAVSYIGIPLAILAIRAYGLDPSSTEAASQAAAIGAGVQWKVKSGAALRRPFQWLTLFSLGFLTSFSRSFQLSSSVWPVKAWLVS